MTPFHPPASQAPLGPGPQEHLLQADYFDGHIDLRAFGLRFPAQQVLWANPLVLEPEPGRFFVLSRFGAVISWNCPDGLVRTLHSDLGSLPGVGPLVESARDRLLVYAGAGEERVGYHEVWLKELTQEKLRIISLALAQSVALDHFDADVSAAMARFHSVVTHMRAKGRLALAHGEVLRLVGFAMEVRSALLNHLALFDDPPETWEQEALDHLHRALHRHFELRERLETLNGKLAYLTDAGATVMEVLATRTSHWLEWIIIVLIFIETGFFIWKEVLFR